MKSVLAMGMAGAILAGLLSAAPAPSAERFSGREGVRLTIDSRPPMHGRGVVGSPPASRPGDSSAYAPRPDHGLPRPGAPRHDGIWKHRHGIIAAAPPVVYYWPGYAVEGSPAYVAPPTYYAPPPVYSSPATSLAVAPPPAPPTPSVIEYPTGRYELRGDGTVVPHAWVWVPNPPAAPPAPPAAEFQSTAAAQPPPRRSALYTWTDRDGVVHWTDNTNSVPEEYRAKVQKRSL